MTKADAGLSRGLILVAHGSNRSVANVIAQYGYSVASAATSATTVNLARSTQPDVIIVAEKLGDMTGIDTCRILRGDPFIPRGVPILLIAAGPPTPEERVTAMRAGAWDFVHLPGTADGITLKLDAYVQAKRNIDEALATDLVVPEARLFTTAGLTREAQRLGALMARLRGAFACVVFEWTDEPPDPETGFLFARAVRTSDTVGALSPRRFGVLAPATDKNGAIKLAARVGDRVRHWIDEIAASHGKPAPGARIVAGCDAVTNARYSPIDPIGLIARATAAIRNGMPDGGVLWVRAHEPHDGAGQERHSRSTPANAPHQPNLRSGSQ